MDIYDPTTRRHEDHVGHKIEWENDIQMNVRGAAGNLIAVTCDVLAKLHQGTHSKDAFTNNLHEFNYHLRCSDGGRIHMTMLTAIGRPGEMLTSCDRRVIQVGPATPVNSPNGNGRRIIPDLQCVEQHLLAGEGGNSNIRQFVSKLDNSGLNLHGPVIGRDRDYSAPGVRAPN